MSMLLDEAASADSKFTTQSQSSLCRMTYALTRADNLALLVNFSCRCCQEYAVPLISLELHVQAAFS